MQIGKLWEARQELNDLEGCRPHNPRGEIRCMYGTADEVGHPVWSLTWQSEHVRSSARPTE